LRKIGRPASVVTLHNGDLYSVFVHKDGKSRIAIPKGASLPIHATQDDWEYVADLTRAEIGTPGLEAICDRGYWSYRADPTI
jgi:hypothetical protein